MGRINAKDLWKDENISSKSPLIYRQAKCLSLELKAAEEKLAWGVSLPKITKELYDEFEDTCLMNAEEWSQVAVDFAGVLNSTLLSEEQDKAP